MRAYRFIHADVFTNRAFGGNPLAVFADARGLSSDEMQTLAREMNFAESSFVLPPEIPGAVKRVRIFTPGYEMPFAGHPTIGATYVLARERVIPLDGPETTAHLQLNIGLTAVTITAQDEKPDFVWMRQRPAEFGEVWPDVSELAEALGVERDDIAGTGWPVQIVSTGVPYLIVPLRSLAAIRPLKGIFDRARAGSEALRHILLQASGGQPVPVSAYLFTRETEAAAHTAHARMFNADPADLLEDAATGSAAGPLGAYFLRHNIVPAGRLVVEQGYEMGRPSLIHVEVDGSGHIGVGGQTVIVGEGVMYLP